MLWRILRHFDISPHEAVYIGDSLTRDVRVAQQAGVHDVYAEHGLAYDSPLYERLIAVTHWSAADVRRETELRRHPVTPTARIAAFPELLNVLERLEASAPERHTGSAHEAQVDRSTAGAAGHSA